MATLVSTIKLASSTLFPTPINFTVPVTENIMGDAAFSTIILGADTIGGENTANIYGPTTGAAGSSEVVYVYLNAAADNTAPVLVNITDDTAGTSVAMKLIAGDFAWFPLYAAGAGVTVQLENTDAVNTATVNYFYGERG
jgi:hypothetical protein